MDYPRIFKSIVWYLKLLENIVIGYHHFIESHSNSNYINDLLLYLLLPYNWSFLSHWRPLFTVGWIWSSIIFLGPIGSPMRRAVTALSKYVVDIYCLFLRAAPVPLVMRFMLLGTKKVNTLATKLEKRLSSWSTVLHLWSFHCSANLYRKTFL